MKSLFGVILLAGLLASLALSQPPIVPPAQDQTPTIKTAVEEVILDVIIRDKKGRPIKDLTAADVSVSDNGVKQKITSFRLVDGKEAISNGATTLLDPLRQIRLVTLTFEGLSPEARRLSKEAALSLISGPPVQNVYYSVFTIGTSLFALQEFTNDRDKLRKAINLATSGQILQYSAENERTKTTVRQTLQRAAVPAAGPGQPQAGAAMGAQATETRLAQIMNDMMSFDQATTTAENTRMSIFSLLSLVRGQSTLPGRKTILYFSEGLMIPTHLDEPFRSIMSTANRTNVTFYAIDCRGVQSASSGASAQMRNADDVANATGGQNAGATAQMREAARLSAEDITRTDGAVSKEAMKGSDTAESASRNNVGLPLRDLSESTGGFLIGDSNDLRVPLRQVTEEINSYYEIAYNPGIENYDGSFRKTNVDVTRKDTVIHSRTGYFALPATLRGPAMLPFEMPLLKALDSNPLPRQIEFRSTALHFQPTPTGIKAAALVELPLANVEFTEDPATKTFKARVSVVALLKDDKGEVVQKFSRDLPLAGPAAQVPAIKSGNFIYKEQFEVPPGRYTLQAALLDHQANKLAARKTAFVVLAKTSGVSLSSLSLVRNFQAGAKDLQPSDPFQYKGGRITPTLSGTVYAAKGAQLSMFFTVYPDPKLAEKPIVTLEYLVDGKSVAKLDVPLPPADADGRIPYVMSSPAENMPPGIYQIKATARQGTSVAEESAFVTVAAKP